MASFADKRKHALEKKNDAATKAIEFEEKAEKLEGKKKDLDDAEARIPKDLPDEIQAQIESGFERNRQELKDEASDIEKDAKEAQDTADENLDDMREESSDLSKKGDDLKKLGGVPLVGEFMEKKGNELHDQSEQMKDIAQETQQMSDRIANARNRLMSI